MKDSIMLVVLVLRSDLLENQKYTMQDSLPSIQKKNCTHGG